MSARQKVWLAIALSSLSSPFLCGVSVAWMLGEKPMPVGRIGQEPWQPLGVFFFGLSSIASAVVCLMLLNSLFGRVSPRRTNQLVRLSGIAPIGAGVSLVFAGVLRMAELLAYEGILALLFGLGCVLVGWILVSTKQTDSVAEK